MYLLYMKRDALLFLGITLLLFLYYYLNYSHSITKTEEGFNSKKNKCANLLVERDNKIYLINTDLAEVPGVNPIVFDNLEEYIEYQKWLRYYNIKCPILYLKQEYDVQNNRIYKFRPSFKDTQGGVNHISASHDYMIRGNKNGDLPRVVYKNSNIYPFDPNYAREQDRLPIDKMFNAQEKYRKKSTNAMDINWGGYNYTKQKIDEGEYDGSKILIRRR